MARYFSLITTSFGILAAISEVIFIDCLKMKPLHCWIGCLVIIHAADRPTIQISKNSSKFSMHSHWLAIICTMRISLSLMQIRQLIRNGVKTLSGLHLSVAWNGNNLGHAPPLVGGELFNNWRVWEGRRQLMAIGSYYAHVVSGAALPLVHIHRVLPFRNNYHLRPGIFFDAYNGVVRVDHYGAIWNGIA